jgi:hypothetical protein
MTDAATTGSARSARSIGQDRADEATQGHWLLARLGKRVLRPGGVELTGWLLDAAQVPGADVVELAPGLGRTAADVIARSPRSYRGVDADAAAATADD